MFQIGLMDTWKSELQYNDSLTGSDGSMCMDIVELPEVEVGEGLEVAQAGGQWTHPIVVKAQRLQRDELTELLRQLTQTVLRQIWRHKTVTQH